MVIGPGVPAGEGEAVPFVPLAGWEREGVDMLPLGAGDSTLGALGALAIAARAAAP